MLGATVSFIFLFLFLYRVDLSQTWESLKGIRLAFLFPAIAIYFVALYLRSVRWSMILKPLPEYSGGNLFSILAIGYMANNLLPLRIGELLRVYYLNRKYSVGKIGGLATIAVERVFDGITLLIFGLIAFSLIPGREVIGQSNYTSLAYYSIVFLGAVGLFLGWFVILISMIHWPRQYQRFLGYILKFAPPLLREKIMGWYSSFLKGLGALTSIKLFSIISLISGFIWLGEWAMYLVMAYSANIHLEVLGFMPLGLAILLTISASNLGLTVPSTGGGVGPFEFFAKLALVYSGVTAATAASFVIILHITLLVPVTILGLFMLWRDNLSIIKAARMGINDVQSQ